MIRPCLKHVLGVRLDAPVWKHQIIIEPHLADLTHAEGVVAELGPVPAEWKNTHGVLHFKFTVPAKTKVILALPKKADREVINVDGKQMRGKVQCSRHVCELDPGNHIGSY